MAAVFTAMHREACAFLCCRAYFPLRCMSCSIANSVLWYTVLLTKLSRRAVCNAFKVVCTRCFDLPCGLECHLQHLLRSCLLHLQQGSLALPLWNHVRASLHNCDDMLHIYVLRGITVWTLWLLKQQLYTPTVWWQPICSCNEKQGALAAAVDARNGVCTVRKSLRMPAAPLVYEMWGNAYVSLCMNACVCQGGRMSGHVTNVGAVKQHPGCHD